MQNVIEQQFNQELQEKLRGIILPKKYASPNWNQYAEIALNFTSPMAMGLTATEFGQLIDFKERQMNAFEFATLNNNLERRTPEELQLDLPDYVLLMQEVDALAFQWNNETKEMRENLIKEIVEAKKLRAQ